MPYDRGLAERLEEILAHHDGLLQKKMFGGIGWLLNGNMCVGVYRDCLIIRVGESAAERIVGADHVRPMDITGRPMKGWAMVVPEGIAEDAVLLRHVALALDFVRSLPAK